MLIYSNKQNEKNSTTVNKKKRNTNIALSKFKKKDVHKKSFFFKGKQKKRGPDDSQMKLAANKHVSITLKAKTCMCVYVCASPYAG